jgi:hypothetical protein
MTPAIARCRAEQAQALAYLAEHPGDFGASLGLEDNFKEELLIMAKLPDYDPANALQARIILDDIPRFGGEDALPVLWARAVQRRLGYSDLWDHDLPREEKIGQEED